MARTTVEAQLAKLRKERATLEAREKQLLAKTNDKALGKIVEMVKAAGLTSADVARALKASGSTRARRGGKSPGRKGAGAKAKSGSGAKVAPKYRNPSNTDQTWTGRGRAPVWAQELRTAGRLETALISL